jgi:hypothetical protein
MISRVGVQERLVGQKGGEGRQGRWARQVRQLGGKAGRKAEKLDRTGKKATGGRKRHGLCSQGWASTAGR